MGSFSLIHWIILAVLLLLLFGGNRFSAMMGDVAKGLKSFKQGLADDEDEKSRRERQQQQLPPQTRSSSEPLDITPRPSEPAPRSDDQQR